MDGFRRSAIVMFGVLVTCLVVGASGASAGPKPVQPCITPTSVDLNVRWGISAAIVAPFCTEIASGRSWVPSNAWFMNTFFEVVPPGFVPAGATPLDDFKAKFIGVKYVVDPGTSQQKIYQFPSDDSLGVILNAGGFDVVNPITLGTLKPLSVGDHVVDSYLIFSAMHCDGLGGVVADNCLGPGEVLFPTVEFTVRPGH